MIPVVSVNPLAALIAVIINTIPVFISFDIYTPAVFLALAVANTILVSHIRVKEFLKLFMPLTTLPVSLFFLNLFFSASIESSALYHLFGFTIQSRILLRAFIIFLRSFTLIYISVSYLTAVNAIELVNSLMQQIHLSPRIGYSIYTAWNIIPFIGREITRIKNVHLIRSGGKRNRIKETIPLIVTILINSIRHAERASVSMYIRGLEDSGSKKRTFLHNSKWRPTDTIYAVSYFFIAFGLFFIIIKKGLFRFSLG
ncbi:MAG: energy-coupling factor transporter transmembrane protein EcfT [Spirochaetes bacterium]|nr:energy-coupling factor transporter transmembrane protein EcfT [Spirochaetota bacterium]